MPVIENVNFLIAKTECALFYKYKKGMHTGLYLTVSSLMCSLVNLKPMGRRGILRLVLFWREEQPSCLERTLHITLMSVASSTL